MTAWRADDEAVSPVIGVILMVAITVVLAGVVFAFATQLSDRVAENDVAPRINFIKRAGDLVVQKAEGGADWADLQVDGTCTTVPTGAVAPGQRIEGCTGAVTVHHVPSNTLLFQGTF